MSRDMTDTANPREPSSLGFSHFLVALRQVDRRLGDELTVLGDDPDVVSGDVEPDTGSRPGSAHPEVEHPIAEPQTDLAADIDLVVTDAEMRIHRRHAGRRSPWQRGSNENTNGLLRQYMPKGEDLSQLTARDLLGIERSLNDRPRKTLGFMKPSEKLADLLALTG